MNKMKWLIKREFWENKGSLFWAPIIVGAVLVLFATVTVAWSMSQGHFAKGDIWINGHMVDKTQALASMPAEHKSAMVDALASGYLVVGAPLLLVLGQVIFFYCLAALYDERRDRSILFWKSLPLSDASTVLSKVATATVAAPLVTLAVAMLTALALLLFGLIVMAFKGLNLFGPLLTHPAFYLTPLQLVALLPIYALWALPTVGYLLLVSAWARSKVFLWAVGIPLSVGVLLKWVSMFGAPTDAEWFMKNVVVRLMFSQFPTWLADNEVVPVRLLVHTSSHMVDMGGVLTQSYLTLTRPDIWIGAVAGAAMIYGAMRLRRWKDEG